jgi:hemoglobin
VGRTWASLAPRPMATTGTIFERYGGFAAVRRIVSEFYDRVLESPVLAHHFEHVDMRRLLDHQARFISSVTGGPASYTDEHLRRVHERLAITTDEFREMLSVLVETLEDFDWAEDDIEHVARELRRREGIVVTA